MDTKTLFQLRVPPEMAEQIKALASANLRSINNQIIYFVREGLKREVKTPSDANT